MSNRGNRTVEPWEYADYINSPEWQAVRERYFKSKLPKECYCCAAPWRPGFHLHHRTYKNLGAENLRDLVLVCPSCHSRIHENQKLTGASVWGCTSNLRHKIHPVYGKKARAKRRKVERPQRLARRAAMRQKRASKQGRKAALAALQPSAGAERAGHTSP